MPKKTYLGAYSGAQLKTTMQHSYIYQLVKSAIQLMVGTFR
jgi:hypothetical protein